jgi:excisionase family DNA binding protein
MTKKNLITSQEAAEYLNIHVDTIRDWEAKGYIKSIRTPGNHRRYDMDDVKELLGKNNLPLLSIYERQVLANQHEILKSLSTDEEDIKFHERYIEIYKAGYEHLYYDNWIDKDVFTKERSQEALEILNMFLDLQNSYEQLDDKSNINPNDLIFMKFDDHGEFESYNHSNENRIQGYASFVRFYCKDRFKNLKVQENCGSSKLMDYRKMLTVYKEIDYLRKSEMPYSPLTKENIISIIKHN